MPDDSTGGFHMSDDNDSQGYTEGPPDDAPATDAPAEREALAQREAMGDAIDRARQSVRDIRGFCMSPMMRADAAYHVNIALNVIEVALGVRRLSVPVEP